MCSIFLCFNVSDCTKKFNYILAYTCTFATAVIVTFNLVGIIFSCPLKCEHGVFRVALCTHLFQLLATAMFKRSDRLVRRVVGTFLLNVKVTLNDTDNLFLMKSNINKASWYSRISCNFMSADARDSGSVWLLYLALFATRIALFCSIWVWCSTYWVAFPYAINPYVKWECASE